MKEALVSYIIATFLVIFILVASGGLQLLKNSEQFTEQTIILPVGFTVCNVCDGAAMLDLALKDSWLKDGRDNGSLFITHVRGTDMFILARKRHANEKPETMCLTCMNKTVKVTIVSQ